MIGINVTCSIKYLKISRMIHRRRIDWDDLRRLLLPSTILKELKRSKIFWRWMISSKIMRINSRMNKRIKKKMKQEKKQRMWKRRKNLNCGMMKSESKLLVHQMISNGRIIREKLIWKLKLLGSGKFQVSFFSILSSFLSWCSNSLDKLNN